MAPALVLAAVPVPVPVSVLVLAPSELTLPELVLTELAPAPPEPAAVSAEPVNVDAVLDSSPVVPSVTATSCTDKDSQPRHSTTAARENPSHVPRIGAPG